MTCLGAPACTTIPDALQRSLHGRPPANLGRIVEFPKQTHNEEPPRYRLPLRFRAAKFFPAVHAAVPRFLPATEFRPDRANRTRQNAREFRVAAKDPVVFCPAVSAVP